MDRSRRTYEEYRQLYWDEKARRKELQSQLADAEKTRIAIAHIRDKKSTEARHRYEVAEAQLDKVAVEAYSIGYESGHNDTVESVYCGDSMERAEEWWDEHSESITGDKK